jgi:hypothetical protein
LIDKIEPSLMTTSESPVPVRVWAGWLKVSI